MALQWYVIHTQAGCENRVKENLEHRVQAAGMKDKVTDVLVPTEQVAEFRGGEKRVVNRKFFPGYVLVRMEMNEQTWYLVRSTPGVSGFVGAGREPVPLRDEEIENILKAAEKQEAPQPKMAFEKGDAVRVIEGPFMNFTGVVDELYPDKGKMRVMVSIFGRQTPVELEYWQCERV